MSDADSESEDFENETYYKDIDCFFDERELQRIQLDEFQNNRVYTRIICFKNHNRELDDFILIDKVTQVPPKVTLSFQYYMENIQVI